MTPADDVPWLDADQLRDWISLCAMVSALPAAIDAQLRRDAGVNMFEYQVMAGLSDSPDGAIRMSALAAFASGSLSRLSHAVGRLEKQGWVVRRPCADDARATEAVLTDAGAAKMRAIAPAHVREARRLVVDALSPAQLTQLGRLSRTLVGTAAPETARMLRTIPPFQR